MAERPATGLSVVVSTYEWPDALDAVLRGLHDQSDASFDVVVTDDGSGAETAAVAERWRQRFGERFTYVRQPDQGFRLARARNLGALHANSGALAFIDGDVIPRHHFVRALRGSIAPGWFVAGKRLLLSAELTHRVVTEHVPVQRWSVGRWLSVGRSQAHPLEALTARDRRRAGRKGLPEFVPHAEGYGFLLAMSRGDFVRVNGYDARFLGWGAEDVDMAIRLGRLGLRCGWPGPQGTLLHLWHESRKHGGRPNEPVLEETRRSDRVRAVQGLAELAGELSSTGAGNDP